VTDGARAADLALRVALIVTIAVLGTARLLLRGDPGVWAMPDASSDPASRAVSAVLLTGGLVLAGWAWQRIHRAGLGRWSAAAASLMVGGVLAALSWVLAPPSYFGDWKTLIALGEAGKTIGKWYGAGLVYSSFHQGIGAPLGATPAASAAWVSCLAGAANAYLFYVFARVSGLVRAFPAWPFLYAGAFGVVGLGLGHVEIYAVVATAIGGVLLCAVWLFAAPSPGRTLLLGAVGGLALCTYLGAILLVPILLASLVVVLLGAWKAGNRRLGLAAIVAAALLVVPLAVGQLWSGSTLGPGPLEKWADQFTGRAEEERAAQTAGFLPPDVHSPHLRNVMRVGYAVSPRHVGEMAQQLALDQLLPLLLALLFGVRRVRSWLARERPRGLDAAGLLLAAAAALYLLWAWTVVPGLPSPIDWDLRAISAVPVLYLAGWLLAAEPLPARGARLRRGLAGAAALVAAFCGLSFLEGAIEPPRTFGPEAHGLRLGAVPSRLVLEPGGYQHLWFWIENDGQHPFVVDAESVAYELWAKNRRSFVQQPSQRRRMRARRHFAPGARRVLIDFGWEPRGFLVAEPEYSGREPDWREIDGLPPPGRYVARWHVALWLERAEQTLHLESQDVELVVQGRSD
jgi:hypothetical protein